MAGALIMAGKKTVKSVRIGKSISRDKPLLEHALKTRRLREVMLFSAVCSIILVAKAGWVQIQQTSELKRFGELSYTETITTAASRGKIYDRNDVVLASSLPARAITVDPQLFVEATTEQRKALAEALDIKLSVLDRKVARGGQRFAYLKRQVDVPLAERILARKIPGVRAEPEFKRHYPEGPIAAHLVGFTDYDDNGQEGIELIDDAQLKGTDGLRHVFRNRLGRKMGDFRDDVEKVRDPVNGNDVHLSIDSRLQYQAFEAVRDAVQEHQAKAGSVVVLDVETGEVLAMANWPAYDPNNRQNLRFSDMRNRALIDSFEPGSTIKPFTIALGLELRAITPNTLIDTDDGKMTIGPDTIGDSHKVGTVTVTRALVESSNVAAAKIALDLKPEQMWSFLSAVGFGQAPSLHFPGVIAGRMRPWRKWRPIEQATMAYGHGMSVSLVQLAHAYMIFARDGDLPPLTLLRSDRRAEGQQIISSRTAHEVRDMLEQVVGPEGTGKQARVIGFRVAGKTGTARKIEDGVYVKKYGSTFVGFAPASAPRVIVAALIDEPAGKKYYGGDVSAPLFSRVTGHALRQLRITPDAPVAEVEMPISGSTELR